MSGCSCSSKPKEADKAASACAAEKKRYICQQCNTFKEASAETAAPECCGKKMQEMD